jgi:hypothetical protein
MPLWGTTVDEKRDDDRSGVEDSAFRIPHFQRGC